MTCTISKNEISSYTIKTSIGDYGVVALSFGEHSATVMAESSFGSYCYHWNSTGNDPIGFLQRIKFDYAMGKFKGRDIHVFDRCAQEQDMKKTIISLRRKREIDSNKARNAFDDISEICQCNTVSEFKTSIYYSDLLIDMIYQGDYASIDVKTMPCPQSVGFWNDIWVPLMNHLKEIQ